MNIAFLTPEYPDSRFGPSGGIGSSIRNLAKGLAACGHSVRIIIYGQPADRTFSEDGITFHTVKNIKLKGLSWYLTRKKIQKLINTLHDNGEVEIVEAPDWTGITSFMKLKCPLVIRLHGSDTYFCHHDKRKVKFFNRLMEKAALARADSIVSVSLYTGLITNQLFRTRYSITTLPNGIDPDMYTPVQHPVGAQKILYFGSIIRKKGVLELAMIFNQVAAKIPSAELVIVGKDVPDIITGAASTWVMMEALIEPRFLDRVSYLGPVPHAEVPGIIADADVCVFPSFAEALPVSWLEAMAMEKAIVASDIGWAPEMIADGISGYLVHPANHKLFAEKICSFLSSPDVAVKTGKLAREKVESDFNIRTIIDKTVTLYNTLLKR